MSYNYGQQGYGQQGYGQQGYGQHTTHNTTVVVQQPGPQIKQRREWRSGLCGCFNDIPSCLLVCLFFECYGCYLATQADEHCCLGCLCPGFLVPLRSYVRGRLGIQGSVMKDMCATGCCPQLVMCQIARELKESRGTGEWNMS